MTSPPDHPTNRTSAAVDRRGKKGVHDPPDGVDNLLTSAAGRRGIGRPPDEHPTRRSAPAEGASRITTTKRDRSQQYRRGVTGTRKLAVVEDQPASRELTEEEYLAGAVLAGLRDARDWAQLGLDGAVDLTEAVCTAIGALRRAERLVLRQAVSA